MPGCSFFGTRTTTQRSLVALALGLACGLEKQDGDSSVDRASESDTGPSETATCTELLVAAPGTDHIVDNYWLCPYICEINQSDDNGDSRDYARETYDVLEPGQPDMCFELRTALYECLANRVTTVLQWSAQLGRGAAILDVGCGHGDPISTALVRAGFAVHGIDASPNMVAAFRERLPGVPIVCEPIETSTLHGRIFAGIVAWGVVFLLPPETQRSLVDILAHALVPNGRLLFTAPAQPCTWIDVLTHRESTSLGAEVYRALISAAGLDLVAELDDEGDNHYFSAVKP